MEGSCEKTSGCSGVGELIKDWDGEKEQGEGGGSISTAPVSSVESEPIVYTHLHVVSVQCAYDCGPLF